MPIKITRQAVAEIRQQAVIDQGRICTLCQQPLTIGEAVLDHDHKTGAVRSALHRSCNSLLGKIENNYRRFGVEDLQAFLAGVGSYLRFHSSNRSGFIHWSHKERPAPKAKSK